MKVLTCTSPGHLEYGDQPAPKLSQGQAILRIRRIGICGTDLHAFQGTQPYFTYPRILGHELAAEVVDIAPGEVHKAGDQVTVIPYFYCGQCVACINGKPNCCATLNVCGVHSDGGMREYLSVPAYTLIGEKDINLDGLALVEPLAIGAHAVRRAAVARDEFVLVVGAGPIGMGTIEFARLAGGKVIVVDVVQARLDFCAKHFNLENTINAATEDVYTRLKHLTAGNMPTVVFDVTGNLSSIHQSFSWMAHGARYVLVGLQKENITFSHPEFHKREGTLMSSRNATREDFANVISAIVRGKIDPCTYITHRVPFNDVKDQFSSWLDPRSGVIKAMVEL